MKNIAKMGIVGLLLVGLVASAFAFSGRGFGNEAAKDAVEAGDYEAWKDAHINGLTEDRFDQIRERHLEREERRAEMDAAIDEGYDAWLDVVEDTPKGEYLTSVVSEDNFDRFVDMHEARESGDHDTAKEIAEELGLEHKGGHGRGRGQGMGKGRMK